MGVRHNVDSNTLPMMRAKQAQEAQDWKMLTLLAKPESIKEFYAAYAAYLKKNGIYSKSRQILYDMAILASKQE